MQTAFDKTVIQFINNFLNLQTHSSEDIETLRKTFMDGYCYYFAHMLKAAFDDGEVCWCAPYGHFVWVCNDVAYDIEGVYVSDCLYYIPEKYLGEAILDFKRIPGKEFNASKEDIEKIIDSYLNDRNQRKEKI